MTLTTRCKFSGNPLLQSNDKNAAEKRSVISLLCHPSTNRVRKITQSNWISSDLPSAITDRICDNRDTNLRDMLVRSKLCHPATRTSGTTPRNQAKCGTCPFICTNTNITGPKSQMNITKQFNCLTYILYVIHCTKCAQIYIGEIGRTLDTRFKEHLADIKHRRGKPVANHFNQTDHTIHNIRVKGLWLLFTDSVNDRKDMASRLIDKLGSRKPGGMNERPGGMNETPYFAVT